MAGSTRMALIAQCLYALSGLIMFLLPDTIGGSYSGAFAVFLVVIFLLGAAFGLSTMCLSTITSTWNEHIVGQYLWSLTS